jgi:micrococcal nuclease
LAASLFVAIVILAALARRSPHPAASATLPVGADYPAYHDKTFKVVGIADGDTIYIDAPDQGRPKTRVRLLGLDAPEVEHPKEPAAYFGPEAAEFARKTLEGRDVFIVLSRKNTRDKYERLLAYIYLERGGSMFNEMLLEQGYAYADLKFDHEYRSQFADAEKRARRAKAGLWKAVRPDQMPAWRQNIEGPSRKPGETAAP